MSPTGVSQALERPHRLRALGRRPSGKAPGGRSLLGGRAGTALGGGLLGVYLSVLVLLPIAALLDSAASGGTGTFWRAVSSPEAVAALKLTLVVSAIVVAINALFGTLIAWVLVRDEFPGKGVVNALIDLPFALPTIVAGVVLLALYGKGGPTGIDITFTRTAVGFALLFVTLPFVVRSVQPVLIELDRSMEEAAGTLGAARWTVFRRIVLPNLTPAIISGVALSFARALGEFGSVVLISGNLPFKTEVGSVYIFNQVENDNVSAAASVSVVLLLCALVVLAGMSLLSRRMSRHVL
jgi:sulfate/thiosulfate transport system permease protein